MREEQKNALRQPAPMVIPVISYLTGILTIRVLYMVQGVPVFLHGRMQGTLLVAIFLCIAGLLCTLLMPRFTSLRFPRGCYAWSIAALFFTGSWSYHQQNNLTVLPQNNEFTLLYGKVERVTLTKSERFMRLTTRLLAFRQEEEPVPCNTTLSIYIPIERYDPNLQAGSTLLTVSRIENSPPAKRNSFPPSVFISKSNPLSFRSIHPSFPARLHTGLLARLNAAIRNPDAFALIAGLSIGYKEAFDPELKNAYAGAGASHILAVSGLHMGIVYAILLSCCNLFLRRNSRTQLIIKQIIILSALTLFAALAGFTPSVTRALLMVALSMAGKVLQRPLSSMQTLFTTAFIICIINPAAIFEVSFQLSFCAVFAILTLQPPLQRLWRPKTKAGQYVWSLMTVSTAAQLGTAPLAYYYFGAFPYLFLLTNLIVIPLTAILLYLLCLWIALGTIPVAGTLLPWAMEQIAWLMNHAVVWIDRI